MQVTIITPTLNSGMFLETSLNSVSTQTGDFTLEHWIIDGGSTDDTLEIVERQERRPHFISEPDRGQAHAVNKGLDRASGDIIGWLNADDIYLPGALDKVTRRFRQDPVCQWLIGKCHIVDARGHEIRKFITWYKNNRLLRYSYKRLLHENYIAQPAVFFRRSFVERVGLLDESLHYAMDYDWWLRMGAASTPVVLDADLAAFRWHRRSKTVSQLRASLDEARGVVCRYAARRPAVLARAWWYRTRIRIAYALLDAVRR